MLLVAALPGIAVLGGWAGKTCLLAVNLVLGTGTAIMSPTWRAIIPLLVPLGTGRRYDRRHRGNGCLDVGSVLWGQTAAHRGIATTLFVVATGAVIALVPVRRLTLQHQAIPT
jgi:hypothetical protein